MLAKYERGSISFQSLVWSANGDGSASASLGKFQGQFTKDRWDSATVIMSSFGQLEQGVY